MHQPIAVGGRLGFAGFERINFRNAIDLGKPGTRRNQQVGNHVASDRPDAGW